MQIGIGIVNVIACDLSATEQETCDFPFGLALKRVNFLRPKGVPKIENKVASKNPKPKGIKGKNATTGDCSGQEKSAPNSILLNFDYRQLRGNMHVRFPFLSAFSLAYS